LDSTARQTPSNTGSGERLTVEIKKRGRGRPKGAKDSKPRLRPNSQTVGELKKKVTLLTKKLDEVVQQNRRLQDNMLNNPVNLVPISKASEKRGKDLTEAELEAIANSGEIPPGAEDELLALTHRRKQVSRLLLRGISRAVCASHLGVSLATINNDVRAIRRQWRDSVNGYNISEAIGESLEFYREVRDLALNEASDPLNKTEHIIQAAQAALRAEDAKNAFLARVGLYDVLDEEKRNAFKASSKRELTQDAEEFNGVLSFMQAAATKRGTTLEQIAQDAQYSDVEPLDTD
jgi:hypothetical protein